MAVSTIPKDFWAQEEEICCCFQLFPFYLPCSNGVWCHDLSFIFCKFSLKPALSLSSFTLIKRLFSSSLLSAIRLLSCTHLRLLMFLPIFIPACNWFSLAFLIICSVQFGCSVMSDSVTAWTATRQASLSITNSWSLLKLISIKLVMPSNHLILCRPLLLPPSIFTSIRVFSNESVLHISGPKYWSFSFNISPSNEYSELISFKIDWLDLLAVQGTLKSLLQHHSSKASIRWHSIHTWLLEKS